MSIYELAPEEVFLEMNTSTNGLTDDEAQKRLESYGANQIEEVKQKPIIYKFLANLYQLLALLLWAASFLAFLSGTPQLGAAIIAVILINAVFSFWQEYQAEKAIGALKKILPSQAKVLREGESKEILTADLVPGDVLLLGEGDNISADARLVEAYQMKVDSSTLTGESRPVRKIESGVKDLGLPLVEVSNLVFAGTSVASGSGKAVVFATGAETEFNQIAALTQELKEEPSPLQKELNRLTRVIAVIAILLGLCLFAINVWLVELPLTVAFIFAIGLTVANVPEGLLPTVTLSLAASVQKMAQKNALIKRLASVETLGSTTIICTDKTGTLTRNAMTVRQVWVPYGVVEVTGTGYEPDGSFLRDGKVVNHHEIREIKLLMRAASFCNDAQLIAPQGLDEKWRVLGDPTEAALLVAAEKIGFHWQEEIKNMPRIVELPFDSQRKSMSSIHQRPGQRVAYVKGAPKKIIGLSSHISVDGNPHLLSKEGKKDIVKIHDKLASQGLRILAMAYRNLPPELKDYTPEEVETDLTLVGMVAMQDPPRPEVHDAVKDCQEAGIRIIMITGDYGLTAESIAREVGIIRGEHCKIIKGKDLNQMSDDVVREVLMSGENVIFARAVPEHKMRIASLLEDEDEIVAMTGDGVNDAPALRKADIGVAMGVTGTDVAKEASDMVLTDDNFATIVTAITEGRTIYENIRKFITYIFAHETAEIIPFVFMVLFGVPMPITIMQILAIDLGTDTVPALALGVGPPESDVMQRPPRSRKERLLNRGVVMRGYVFLGLIEAFLVMSGYFWVLFNGGWQWGQQLSFTDPLYLKATTMVFAGIVLAQMGNLLACQTSRTSVFSLGIFRNKWIIRGILFTATVLLAIMYLPPLQSIFGTTPLGVWEWIYILSFIPIMLLVEELRKYVARQRDKSQKT